MKLYELPRFTWFSIAGPDASPHIPPLKLHHIDGMYSYCTDAGGGVWHIFAAEEVTAVPSPIEEPQ